MPVFLLTGIFLIFLDSRIESRAQLHKLSAEAVFKNDTEIVFNSELMPAKIIRLMRKKFRDNYARLAKLKISGKMFIEHSANYILGIRHSLPISFSVGQKTILRSNSPNKSGIIYLSRGLHDFNMVLEMGAGVKNFKLIWKNFPQKKWKVMRKENFFSGSAEKYRFEQLIDFQKKSRTLKGIHSFLIYLFLALFVYLGFIFSGKEFSGARGGVMNIDFKGGGEAKSKHRFPSRIFAIDVTKGFAGFLMIIGHLPGGNILLPFGNFGAALFFFCSGMNTILFMDKTKEYRGFNSYQLFFVVLLFFGGYTQIVVAHPLLYKFIPEFLQFNALGILLMFMLFKLFKNPRFLGYIFFFPFLIHFGYQHGLFQSLISNARWGRFFLGKAAFPLFPWSGFLLYGVLLLYLRDKSKRLAFFLGFIGIASVFSVWIFRIPVSRYNMSISYILLALFFLGLLFLGFNYLTSKLHSDFFSSILNLMALVGRNSLMFVYVHYFFIRFYIPAIPDEWSILELVFTSLVVFVFCFFFLFLYEKIKKDYSLLFPGFLFASFLFVMRYTSLSIASKDLNLIDMAIGILFAFLYVQLRGKMRIFLKKK